MTDSNRYVLLGTGGRFTHHVLQALLGQGARPTAYFQSGEIEKSVQKSFAGVELQGNRLISLAELLADADVPCHFNSGRDLARLVSGYHAQFLLVACWPILLPIEVLQSVTIAALNLHPSLLPKFRGAHPVGEQLRSNDPDFGVTLHLLNEQFDRGDIVQQQRIAVTDHSVDGIEGVAAQVGANLFVQSLQTYRSPGWRLTRQ